MVCLLIGIINIYSLPAQNHSSIIYSNPQVELSFKYINGNKYQRDLLLFFDMLKNTHPLFAPDSTPPFDIEEVCESGYQWADQCDSKLDLWMYLQNIVTTVNDGHTTLYPDYNLSMIYPFMFLKFDGKYYLYTVTRQFGSSLGKRIESINNFPIEDVIQSFRPVFCCDNDAGFYHKVSNQISFEVLWSYNPYKNPDSTLDLTFDDGTSIKLVPKTANDRDLVTVQSKWNLLSVRRNSKELFRYEIFEDKSICYFQFNLCEDRSSLQLSLINDDRKLTATQIEQALSRYSRFDMFLEKMFDEIAVKDIKTIVIDVRNNSGGNGNLCEVLLSWLKPYTELVRGRSYSRLSPFWAKHYTQAAKDYRDAFAKKGIAFQTEILYDNWILSDIIMSEDGKYSMCGLDYDELFVKNHDTDKVFNGNVIFIQDKNTYSSAGQLITDARDNNIGIVIGSESTFKPCHYGDCLGWKLPNTEINGSVSYKIFNRPDNTRYTDVSIIPDIDIEYSWNDLLEGVDPYWTWIVNNYGTNN